MEGFGEQFDDETLQQQQQQFSSEYGIEPNDYVDSEEIEIRRSVDHHHRDSSSGKLFVGGVSWETTEETFTNYFSQYGEIMDSVIMMDKHSGRPRGFGFVTFVDPAVAEKILEEDHVIDGRAVEVKRTVPREDMEVKGVSKTKKIFVGGIPAALTEDELNEYFSSYGSIVEHQIMLDHKTGQSRGFGFVTFETEDAVEKIFSGSRIHELGGKQVEIKRAEPKRGGGGGDYSGGAAKSYGGFSSGAGRYGGRHSTSRGRYGGKMGRGYGGYGSYDSYGGYGGYDNYGGSIEGSYGGSAAGFYGNYGGYGGYGGYGYGFGFGGTIYGVGGYGGSGYGTPSGYGAGGAGYGAGKGFGKTGGGRGGYGSGKGYENDGAMNGRYHPYQR